MFATGRAPNVKDLGLKVGSILWGQSLLGSIESPSMC